MLKAETSFSLILSAQLLYAVLNSKRSRVYTINIGYLKLKDVFFPCVDAAFNLDLGGEIEVTMFLRLI